MELRAADLAHVWHPFTDMRAYAGAPWRNVVRAQGVYLFDDAGRAIFDGISSWWAASYGHGQPRIVEAIRAQALELQHTLLGGMAHPRAVELAARLAQFAPSDLNRVYFASDGSSAVEAALKMALQYHAYRGDSGRTGFFALAGAYHGDTFGAMGVGYVDRFHAPLKDNLRLAHMLPPGDTAAAERIFEEHAAQAAALIVEPLVLAAGGMCIYAAEYLARLCALCTQFGVLLIADEIATGFGRTGRDLACGHAEIVPDILCLGKALSGGALPLSACLAREHVYEAFCSDSASGGIFFDGHTFCGNPIACAAAIAALDLYHELDLAARAREHEGWCSAAFRELERSGLLLHVRALGSMAAGEVPGGSAHAQRAALEAWNRGLLIRPLGATLYLWPPLVSTQGEITAMLDIFAAAIAATR